jgi:DNA-binding NarL/FixJ family response regulator
MAYTTFFINDREKTLPNLIEKAGLSSSFRNYCYFSTTNKCVAATENIHVDIIFLVADKSPVTSLQTLRKKFPNATLIVVATSVRTVSLLDVLHASGDGYILQNTSPSEFLSIFQYFDQGGVWISPIMLNKLVQVVRWGEKKSRIADYWLSSVQETTYPSVFSPTMFSTTAV